MQDSFSIFIFSLFLFALGASVGSFLNVVAYRIPEGMSIIRPSSHCAVCKTPIKPLALIPILGFFMEKRKCRVCGTPIGWQHPVIETLAGLGTLLLYYHDFSGIEIIFEIRSWISLTSDLGGPNIKNLQHVASFLASLWLFYSAIPLALIDFRYRILPDVITLPGILVSITLGSALEKIGLEKSLYGAGIAFLLLFTVSNLYRWFRKQDGLGFGDVKYFALLGGIIGPFGLPLALLVASLAGISFAIVTGLIRKDGLKASVPFGPFLGLGALFVHLFSNSLIKF